MEKTVFEDGKYTVVQNEGRTTILRYEETWRTADGDKFINAVVDEVKRLREVVNEVHAWVVCGAITSPEDMAANFSRIAAITTPGASVDDPTPKVKVAEGATATLSYRLVASTGYTCEAEHHDVAPETYGQIVGLLHGNLKTVSA